ncbi:MAG: hypothetical protein P8N99_11320 [Luminiphilus sp.]|nr:hypothetical protein [Luminiphilus sp.]
MLVTVWRHGEAGAAPRDRDRALTPKGVDALGRAVLRFQETIGAKSLPDVTNIMTSPWLRTRQTGDILGAGLAVNPRAVDWLSPSASIDDAGVLFEGFEGHWILVSHQPLVSELLWHWLDSRALPSLAPGGWASVSITDHGQGLGALIASEVSI